MDGSDNIGVYGEAKAEYTRQLCIYLVPALEGYFLDLLESTKETEKDTKRVLWVFQDTLKMFPDWNVDKVQRETEKIITATKCDYMEEILTAVFIAHTKVLSAIRLTSKQKKLQITIPKLEHFLHRTMSECARLLWSNAYLFSDQGTSVERQKNLRQVEQLLQEGVLQSIRGMLPVKSILKEYLTEDGDDGQTTEEIPIEPLIKEEETPKKEEKEEKEEKDSDSDIPVVPVVPIVPVEDVVIPESTIPEPIVSKAVPETTDLSGMPVTPTFVVDTEPSVVNFTNMDAIFDSEDPDQSTIRMANHEDDDDYGHAPESIEIDESSPPQPLDDFEEVLGEDIQLNEGEFETL